MCLTCQSLGINYVRNTHGHSRNEGILRYASYKGEIWSGGQGRAGTHLFSITENNLIYSLMLI